VGKAQEVCNTLTLEQRLDYDVVKATYEQVPEAYRQKFRSGGKDGSQ